MNEVDFQHKIPQFIDYSSRILGKLSDATSNLLIVVREPISWIKSVFIQSIKQDWSDCAQNFVRDQYDFLDHSLNLEFIVNCYKKYFDNVLIIPFEILKDDEDKFWDIISEKFEVPFPEKRIDHKINKSFDLKRTFILSRLNEISDVLLSTLTDSEEYNNIQEKNKILSTYSNDGKWVRRRFVEFASKEQLNKICHLLNISKIPEDFLDFSIPAELIETIESKYIGFLRENIDSKYVNFYKQKLQNHISK